MSACRLVVALNHRRRLAFELRGAMVTSTSQLFVRCRRASLQHDARKQHDMLVQLVKASKNNNGESGHCSQRSSISTVVEEEETAILGETPHDEQDPGTPTALVDIPEAYTLDEPTLETHDELRFLPIRIHRDDHRRFTTSIPGVPTLVPRRRKCGTVLRDRTEQELFLFRDEAEYSDYVDARVTGVHTEMGSVVYYEVDVHLSQMKWQILRRYSEFRKLRQRLLKHLTRRQRCHKNAGITCQICANILQTIEQTSFPARRQRQPWFSVLSGSRAAQKHAVRSAGIVADRKHKLQEFVSTCLLTIRGLRQHSRLMRDSSACEISVALRMIEEFLGLSYTRYMRFLNERGVLAGNDHKSHKSTAHTHDRGTDIRRATIAA